MSNQKNKKKKHSQPVKSKAQIKAEEEARVKEFNKKAIIISAIAIVLIAAIITTICIIANNYNPLDKYVEDTSTEKKDTYYVAMNVKDYGVIVVELDAKAAPKTVENFVKLVREDFYDGLTFHRVMEGFMIQGGDPNANGTGGSSNKIVGEFLDNGYYNPIKHERGVISMARRDDSYDSASSQFFICNANSANVSNLDGSYAAFGHVVKGMDVVDSITEETSKYATNGVIREKSDQAVITEMRVIIYEK